MASGWANTSISGDHLPNPGPSYDSLAEAQRLFQYDLCFNLTGIPEFTISDLVDNWNATRPGESFLTDSRNEDITSRGGRWLFSQLCGSPESAESFLEQDAHGRWVVAADAARQYEYAVQRFLQTIMTPLFHGSGQQARRPEFLGLRWCNSVLAKRNLYLHDGQVLFILTYHKSMNLTNASRWPARFLLPEVGALLIRYLILVQPFRRWLKASVGIPDEVSEYLWSAGNSPWTDQKMTDILVSDSRRYIGQAISVRAWRQISIGICIKKFSGLSYLFDLNSEQADTDDEGQDGVAGSTVAAFHWQASHNPRTGNRAYGGTINFQGGLTDAGLQEFRRVSEIWHEFCRDPAGFVMGGDHTSQARGPVLSQDWNERYSHRRISTTHVEPENLPLVQRLIRRKAPTRRRWTMEQAHTILERMNGAGAAYTSQYQQKAIERVVDGSGQVVAVLGTGEGKSLLYFLPCQLPGAGITVVILPLVVLKQEMARRSQEAGIEAQIWDRHTDETIDVHCPLVFVSVEQAVRMPFRRMLTRLHIANLLDRVVLDECHLVLTASQYRPSMMLLRELRKLTCQMVFLTGTLPPAMVQEFEQQLLLQNPRLIRSITVRTDLEYQVLRCPRGLDLVIDFAIPFIQNRLGQLGNNERIIIYVLSRHQADELANMLGCNTYYSDSGSDEEKVQVLATWRDGQKRLLVATSAFGVGVDYAYVRDVIHIDAPRSAIDFAQEAGRLGRDHQGGMSTVLLPTGWTRQDQLPTGGLISREQAAMQRFLAQPRCRVQELGRFLDYVCQPCPSSPYSLTAPSITK